MDKREIFKMYDKIVNSFEGDNTLKCNIKNIKSVESCNVETIIFEISFKNPYSEIVFTASDEADIIMAKLASYIKEYTGVQFFFDNNSCSLWVDASNKLPVTIIKKILKDEPHGVSTIVQTNEFHHIPDTY